MNWFITNLSPAFFLGIILVASEFSASANGIYRDGIGARAMSLAGADVAWAEGPLGALAVNPAGLVFLTQPGFELSTAATIVNGEFRNRANSSGHLENSLGFVPEAAFGVPLGSTPFTLGLAFIPDALLSADWRYVDTPGGLNGTTSYGLQKHHSEIVVLRSAVGLGWSLGPTFSLGASIGVIYNKNTLEAPYIFQTQPVLQGFKTLLDLETDGVGVNGDLGFVYRPHEAFQLGVTYRTKSVVHSHGQASGNASAQLQSLGGDFLNVPPDFRYDAEVVNHFPQMVMAGLSWKIHPRVRLALEVDWINWSAAFDRLQIKLTHGNNDALNSLIGSAAAEDFAPLMWQDRFIYRGGVEFKVAENFFLRTGYSYGKSPVPDGTLTPLTGAIF